MEKAQIVGCIGEEDEAMISLANMFLLGRMPFLDLTLANEGR